LKTLFATLAGAALLASMSVAAHAENNRTVLCGERQQILDSLETRYDESPAAMGLAGNGSVVELLTSRDGTWTILVTQPSGMACLAAAGQHWESVSPRSTSNRGL